MKATSKLAASIRAAAGLVAAATLTISTTTFAQPPGPAGETFKVSTPNGTGIDGYARLFDAAGTQVDAADDAPMSHAVTANGTYYLGISAYGNRN